MQDWVIHIFATYPVFAYGIIIVVSFIEGPILAMVCGLLVRLGDVPFLPIYFSLMIGDLVGDVFWYSMGHFFGNSFVRRFGKYVSITPEAMETVKRIFHKYKNHILIISKITMGFGFALVTLVTAGIVKIPFKRYIALNFLGQFVWTGLLLFVGYTFGHVYESVNNVLGKITVVALFIIAFAALLGYGRYMKNRMTKAATAE